MPGGFPGGGFPGAGAGAGAGAQDAGRSRFAPGR